LRECRLDKADADDETDTKEGGGFAQRRHLGGLSRFDARWMRVVIGNDQTSGFP
jgi:hypothetical protein